mgnify:CR=1 FL=1
MQIDMKQPILDKNDQLAAQLRKRRGGVGALWGAAGSAGATGPRGPRPPPSPSLRCAVIEGDIASNVDAEKIKAQGIAAVQINTGGACHLESNMISRAIEGMNVDEMHASLEGPTAVAFGYEDMIAPAKILSEFAKKSKKLTIKCGVCDEYGRYKDFLRDLLVFYTSEEHQITLKEYVENMPESQKAIYFASSDSVKHAMSLPQCDQVRARGYELIYLTSPLDEMVLENLRDQDGHPFCNVVTEDLGFETEEEKKAADERDAENKDFLDFVQQSVGGDLAKVKISRKLETLPCCLTTEGGVTLEMEKYFRHGPSEEMRKVRATRVLELNGEHHAFQALKAAWEAGDKEKAKTMSLILARLAEMVSGAEIEDPATFAAQVSELF